ncbi:ABC transporter permease [Haloplasma contractile]|uniref:ABC transporter permease protein n=1 Tax=Haloplasma contractile SSD-17B TaxID=1033810 RepID=U2EFI8_9MOLU|nr:ABC transporter permease [Haloplasma contractile]ERJ13698.1 ABC transporter permease protein [Haloplasma contractile SSD-17B]
MVKKKKNLSEYSNILAPLISIFLGFLVGGIIMLFLGENPIIGFINIFRGGLFNGLFQGNFLRLGNTLLHATTLTLTGLAVAFAFRTGLFNIGVSGQMLFGGFLAVYVGVVVDLPKIIHLPLAIIVAILGGALWASVPAILKARYRINEVVTTIMMNYTAMWVVTYFIKTQIVGEFSTESKYVRETASLTTAFMSRLFNNSDVNIGLFLAIITVGIVWFILERTTFGYELKATGFNHDAANYAGMNVNRNIFLSFVVSGAIAGLAGATHYLGYMQHIKVAQLPTQGFDGIAVALLGLNNPIGVLLSAILFGVLREGGQFLSAFQDIPKEFVDIITGLIIYFAAISLLIRNIIDKISKKKETEVKQND